MILACSKADTNRNAAPAATNANAHAAASPATSSASATAVGVAECDNFITAYETCVSSKVPEQARGPLRDSVARWRTEWKKLADNPQTRGTLAAACKTQLEATRTQMKAYGCTF
jgi:hypothetical protein